jgi:DNA-binding CsgD family transcriptional regulator
VGKTRLLDAAVAMARSAGWTCVRAVGIESESALAGAGLLAVLSPLRNHLGSLPPGQAEVLSAAAGWGPAHAPGDRFLVGAATLGLLSAAASEAPLLVAIDDLHWIDADSAAALTFAARRLGHDRAAVICTQRLGVPLPVPTDGLTMLHVSGLTQGAARDLLGPGFSPAVVDRLVAQTGGNPLALLECRRSLTPAQRSGAATLPSTLPLPDRLQDVYAIELERLEPGARRLAVLCAASRDQAAPPVLHALAGEGLDPEACLAGAGDLLQVVAGTLVFRHPLARSAAWKHADLAERHAAHHSLAAAVADETAATWHRAAAVIGYDETVADELEAVADLDRARRGFAAAAAAMEQASRLTADPHRRLSRLAAATEDSYLSGDAARARRLAAEVAAASGAAAQPRARVLVVQGMLEQHEGTYAAARGLFEQACELATGRLLVQALNELFHTCHLLGDSAGMTAVAARVVDVADPADAEQAMLASYLPGAARVVEGRPDLGAPLIHQALGLLESDTTLRDDPRHLLVAFLCARWLMDPAVAIGYAERRINRAREVGALGVLAVGLSIYSSGLAWIGDHVRAYAVAGEAVELLESLGYSSDVGVAFEVSAAESSGRGMHDEALRLLGRARRNARISGFDPMPPHLAEVVALCALTRGDLAEVVDVLEDQILRFGGIGTRLEPLGVAPVLIEAYLGLGRDDDARELAARFAAAQPGSPQPLVAALVARCEGLVSSGLEESVAAFERSLALHAVPPQDVFEAARTRLLYGMRLRRSGRRIDAREHLDQARREFAEMDLSFWAGRATSELAGTGERAASRNATHQSLTSQETRVALLVAEGMTNREVAAALFLSPKTVEHHVGAVLRKRGLRTRTQLARAMARESRGHE